MTTMKICLFFNPNSSKALKTQPGTLSHGGVKNPRANLGETKQLDLDKTGPYIINVCHGHESSFEKHHYNAWK